MFDREVVERPSPGQFLQYNLASKVGVHGEIEIVIHWMSSRSYRLIFGILVAGARSRHPSPSRQTDIPEARPG